MILAGTASVEVDIVGDLKTLNDKKSQEFNADKWIQEYAEERKFDKTKWENLCKREYKKNYQELQEEKIKKGKTIDKKEIDLFAKSLSICSVKDSFMQEKNSFVIETSSQRKEMEEYRDYLFRKCLDTQAELRKYNKERKLSK